MTEDLSFHHLGLATRSLEAEIAALETLGYRAEADPFVDSGQGVHGVFMVGPGPRIEVLAQAGASTTLEPWLAKGIKLYHQAFEVSALERAMEERRRAGGITVAGPAPAVAFGGRRVAFVMLPSLLLVELIERE